MINVSCWICLYLEFNYFSLFSVKRKKAKNVLRFAV